VYGLQLPIFPMEWQPGDVSWPRKGLDFNLSACRLRVYFLHKWEGAGRALYPTGKPKFCLLADRK